MKILFILSLYPWNLVGNHHDYDDIAPDLFQLSEEDVHAFGTNAKLREVLIPFENLHITGEIGEGMKLL